MLTAVILMVLAAQHASFGRASAAQTPPQRRAQSGAEDWRWRWQVWLPDKWQRIGACETGYGKRPGNWHHQNSGYVSAFGISRRAYDEDARVMGAPPWNDRRNPSPWHQYRAALGHYRLHGGFSGWGCKAA